MRVWCGKCQWCDKDTIADLPGEIAVKAQAFVVRRGSFGFVQDEFPMLDAGQREMLVSATHPACFDEMFGDDDSA